MMPVMVEFNALAVTITIPLATLVDSLELLAKMHDRRRLAFCPHVLSTVVAKSQLSALKHHTASTSVIEKSTNLRYPLSRCQTLIVIIARRLRGSVVLSAIILQTSTKRH